MITLAVLVGLSALIMPGAARADSLGPGRPAVNAGVAVTDAAWAGYQVLASAHGNHPISYVQAEWTVGKVPADKSFPPAKCDRGAPLIAQWVGLGDKNGTASNIIIQAGTLSCSTSKSTYRFFTEDFPNRPVLQGPAISAGDDVYVQVQYEGHGKTRYYLENVTTGVGKFFTDPSPHVDETTAEWILEHPGGNALAMPNFGTVKFWGCAFDNGKFYDLTGNSTKMTMNKGHGHAVPSGVSKDAFSVTWRGGR